jgi:hypothetical protein
MAKREVTCLGWQFQAGKKMITQQLRSLTEAPMPTLFLSFVSICE